MSAEIRLRARQPAHSCLVQAPAGAGKTELLTQRILALLAIVDEPEEILALTFTRKAAAEMRKRVLEALLADKPSDEASAHKLETWQLARQVRQRSDEKGWHLMRHPVRLRMMTLDSLTHSLARQLPLLSGLGAMPAPSEQATALYREAAEAALSEAMKTYPEAAERVLLHLDHQVVACIRLLSEMLAKREQWLDEIAAHGRDMPALRRMLEHNLAGIMSGQLTECAALLPMAVKDELPDLMRFAGGQLNDEALQEISAWPVAELGQLRLWKLIANFLLVKDKPGFRKIVTKAQGFPAGKEFAARKGQIMDMLAGLAEFPALADALHGLRLLPDTAVMEDGQWQVLESLFLLLALANKNLQSTFSSRGEADFTEIALRAMQALSSDGETPGDLLLKLDYRIRHVLVDEFQDTSLLQLRLLQCLTAGWQEGDGTHRSLFMVGDPMQSIYRFRKAEVGLFLRAGKNEAALPAVEPLYLERNFRSAAVIVQWVNRAFSTIFPNRQDPISGAVQHAAAVAALAHEGAVRLHLQTEENAALEADTVVALVKTALSTPSASGDMQRIGILARSRKHLHAIMPALTEAAIPFRAIKILPLNTRPEVRLLRALLRALLHPADRESWAAILRAPCCGLDTRDLHALMGNDPRPVWVLLSDTEKTDAMSADGRARAAFVRQALVPCMAASGRTGVRDFLASAWERLCMPGLINSTCSQNISSALDLIESLDDGGRIDFAMLDERLQKLYAAPDVSEQAAQVELLTMHGAKGLQWDVVILPGLGHRGVKGDSPMLAFSEVPVAGGAIPLMAVRGSTRQPDALYDMVRRVENAKYDNELQRLLYVACTRAERTLHMLGHVSAKEEATKGSLLQLLLSAGRECFGAELQQMQPAEAPAQAARRTLQRVVSIPELAAIEASDSKEQETEYAWAGAEAAPVGNAVHAALQHVAEKNVENWTDQDSLEELARMRRMLMADGLSGTLLDAACKRCSEALARVVASQKGRWLLSGEHAEEHCEWELSERHQGRVVHKVIDRSFVDADGIRWIVDYKTASHEGGDIELFLASEEQRHRGQLIGYVQLLKRLEPEREIKAALYFPLLDAWREINQG